jgi:hypothetical protein
MKQSTDYTENFNKTFLRNLRNLWTRYTYELIRPHS